MTVRAPLTFVYGNCVFADGLSDAWAAFAVEHVVLRGSTEEDKRARFLALLGALEATEADIQILRVARLAGIASATAPTSDAPAARAARSAGATSTRSERRLGSGRRA